MMYIAITKHEWEEKEWKRLFLYVVRKFWQSIIFGVRIPGISDNAFQYISVILQDIRLVNTKPAYREVTKGWLVLCSMAGSNTNELRRVGG